MKWALFFFFLNRCCASVNAASSVATEVLDPMLKQPSAQLLPVYTSMWRCSRLWGKQGEDDRTVFSSGDSQFSLPYLFGYVIDLQVCELVCIVLVCSEFGGGLGNHWSCRQSEMEYTE